METFVNNKGVECVKTQHVDSGTVQWVPMEHYEKNTKLYKLVSGVETHDEVSEKAASAKVRLNAEYTPEVLVTEENNKPSKPKAKPVQKGSTKSK